VTPEDLCIFTVIDTGSAVSGAPKRLPDAIRPVLEEGSAVCQCCAPGTLSTGVVSWSNHSVALDTPPNARRLELLRWIHEGCPESRWSDFTYKTVAIAVREAVAWLPVSKRGGAWCGPRWLRARVAIARRFRPTERRR
jgi:hypothetical protein